MAYQYTFMTLFSLGIAILYWQTPSYLVIFYIFLAAVSGTILHISLNYSHKLVDLSLTQPITFLGLIWGSLFGFYIFEESPDYYTWVGGIIIFSGVLIITYRESYLKKNIAKKSLPLKS